MASVPNPSVEDLLSACSRLRRALAHVQCAVLDLHEAFLQRDGERRDDLERQAKHALDRIRRLSRA